MKTTDCNCKSMVTIPLDEYISMKNTVDQHTDLLKKLSEEQNPLIIYSNTWDYSSVQVLNPTSEIKSMKSMIDALQSDIDRLKETKVPMFNKRGTKVKDLL